MQNDRRSPGLARDTVDLLRVGAVLVPVAAAVDIFLMRRAHPHHPVEFSSFLHSVILWAAFGLLALVPASALGRVRARSSRGLPASSAWGRVLFWMLFPIVVHIVLDRHTSLGQNMAGFLRARPWIEVALALTGLGLLSALFSGAMKRLPARLVAALLLLLAILSGAVLPIRPNSEPAPAASSQDPEQRPNILLLVWDTTRPDHLTPYGYERPTTPELSRFAEECLVFKSARSVSIFTFTSHLSMLTGLYPAATGARLHHMRLDPRLSESVAYRMAQAGYRTGAFVGTWVLAGTTGIQRGFEVYDDQVDPAVCLTHAWQFVHDVQALLANRFELVASNGMPHWFQDFWRPADEVLERALKWIESDDPRPWFCMINLYDVHWPYLPAAESREQLVRSYDGPMDGYLFRSNNYQAGYAPTAEDSRHIADLYDAELRELDREVGQFLKALDLDRTNTAVVLTSDHGEAFGEAGRFKHEDITEPQVRVPLCIRLPGSDPIFGTRSEPTSGVDIAPTLLGLAGLQIPDGLHGFDLLNSDIDGARPILIEDRDHVAPEDLRFAYYEGDWKFVRLGAGPGARRMLFDLSRDPVGERDLAQQYPERTAELELRMDAMRKPWISIDGEVEWTGLGDRADALGGLGYLDGD